MTLENPLVTPAWLESRLSDPAVIAIDCRTRRVPRPLGPSLYESRRDEWAAERIPGAAYLHFVEDLCDAADPTPFTLAAPEQIADALGRIGATERSTLVVYGDAAEPSPHRVWWALTISGHPDVRVLDGGMRRWIAEKRPTESGPSTRAPARHGALRRTGEIADRAAVRAAIDDPRACLMNALSPQHFRGEGAQVFGRPGRIPGSISLPAESLIDPETGCFRSAEELRALFDARIPAEATRLLPYCGGGIAACTLTLALAIAGRTNVTVYDGSLLDWTADPAAQMETG